MCLTGYAWGLPQRAPYNWAGSEEATCEPEQTSEDKKDGPQASAADDHRTQLQIIKSHTPHQRPTQLWGYLLKWSPLKWLCCRFSGISHIATETNRNAKDQEPPLWGQVSFPARCWLLLFLTQSLSAGTSPQPGMRLPHHCWWSPNSWVSWLCLRGQEPIRITYDAAPFFFPYQSQNSGDNIR